MLFQNRWGRLTSSLLLLGILISRPCAASGPVATIAVQPLGISVSLLGIATFQVVAVSGTTMSYQWLKNGTNVPGATGANYSISNVQATDQGAYCVQISNGGGTVTSANAVLTVNNAPPTITSQPQSQALAHNDNATFSVSAIGTGTLHYQWNLDGASVAGATSSTLTLNKIKPGNAGSYMVIVTNSQGSVTSAVATLTVDAVPFITTQPQSISVSNGQSASFSVAAISDSNLSYQWYFNGNALSGSTGSTLTLANVNTNAVGGYTVVLQNDQGSTTSAAAILTLFAPPVITASPQAQAVLLGQNATFGVTALAPGAIGYQWNFNGALLAGQTNATLTLANVQTNQAGSYTVTAMNSYGSTISAAAALTVNVPPFITTQPLGQSIIAGQNGSFSVVAGGTPSFTYQWYLNGSSVAGATTSTLTLNGVTTNKAGNYNAVVKNTWGSVTSVVAALIVNVPAGIAAAPQSQAVILGQNATFTVSASGDAPFSYQWNFNGTPLTGATNSALTLANTQTNQAGSYSVLVANAYGSVTSAVASLTVYVPPTITIQPQSASMLGGQTAVFSVAASGSSPFTYKWYLNGAAISGTSSTLTLTSIDSTDSGNYTVLVTNPGGSITSAVASLTVYGIQQQPQNQTVILGHTATFSVTTYGTGSLNYQWYFNGATLDTGTNAALTLTNAQTNQAGSYQAVITTPGGSLTSSVVTLTVYVPPAITTSPQSLTLLGGQTAVFSVAASGSSPFTYKWYLNGSSVSGGTGSTLTLSNLTSSKAGNYTVLVTNPGGSITSSVASLTIYGIQQQPGNQTVIQGQTASLAVVPYGPVPLGYQWYFNNSTLAGATKASLSLTNAQPNQVGSYFAIIATPVGSITSSVVSLTVNVPATITTQPQSQSLAVGQNATFTVAAVGSGSLTYQWYYSATGSVYAPVGNGSATLTLSSLTTNKSGYYAALVYNSYGTVTSAIVTLTVYVPAGITTQPQNKSVTSGQSATFSVVASGTAPFNYQWIFNNTPVTGATNASLTITNALTNSAGNYSVTVMNPWSSITSSVVNLTVNVPPGIAAQPQSQGAIAGQKVTFSVLATGTAQLTYQWRLNGTPLAGATNSTLSLDNVQPTNNGNYQALVTNSVGSVTSVLAALTVVTNPPTLQAAKLTPNGFSLQLPVPVGRTYIIMASTDAQNWTPIYTNAATTANITFTDTDSANYSQRFYQAVIQ